MPGLLVAGLLGVALLPGCDPVAPRDSAPTQAEVTGPQPETGFTLKLLVIDDERLADEIGRRWNAEDRWPLTVERTTREALSRTDWQLAPDVDLVLFPVAMEARLIDAGQLIAAPDFVLESPGLARSGLLTHYRSRPMAWGSQFWSMPLGSVPILLLHNTSLSLDLQKRPLTWADVDEAVKSAPEAGGQPQGIVYPDSGDWLAWALLARAVPLFRSSAEPGGLFVPETMEPWIDSPPFVRALEELQATAIPPGETPRSPAEVYRMVAQGEAAAGLGWPDADFEGEDHSARPLAIQRLPGAETWFSRRESAWQSRLPDDARQYDLLHADGRAVAVTSASLHAGEAFELAAWLSGGEPATMLSAQSDATGPFRAFQLSDPAPWTGAGLAAEQAANWSAAIRDAHSSGMPFVFPGVAAPDEYLAALAAAVRRTLAGSAGAQESLNQAAEEWRAITSRIGVAEQKANLRRHGY